MLIIKGLILRESCFGSITVKTHSLGGVPCSDYQVVGRLYDLQLPLNLGGHRYTRR